ncbi:MAG TPA: hypothetical protein PLL67_06230, partial [Gammaproteobacteria bacterium]|nr:hypothetical protein [Gammaproteobacteria bacterium]
HLQYNVARASVNVALNMSINRQSPGDALKAGLTDAAVGTAAGAVAQKIGGLRQEGRIGYASHKLLHAALGAVGGAILAGPKGAVAGAIGAAVAEIGAEAVPEEPKINSEAEQKRYQEERSRAANIGKLAGATTTLLMHQDVGTAVATATYAVENNFLTSSRRPASLLADFDEDADVLELNDALNDEMNESEFIRELDRERRLESMTFKLDSRGVPGNAWEHLAEDRGSVTPPGGLRRTDDNTFMPLWSLVRDCNSAAQTRVEVLAGLHFTGLSGNRGLSLDIFSLTERLNYLSRMSLANNPNWGCMALRALMGDRSPDILDFQQQNRLQMPIRAAIADGFRQGRETLDDFFYGENQKLSWVPSTSNKFATALLFSATTVGRSIPKLIEGCQYIGQRVQTHRKLKDFNNSDKQRTNHSFSKAKGSTGRPKFGHMEDTPENRKMLVETWGKGERVEVNKWGKETFAKWHPNGKGELWVRIQNNKIESGGLNEVPRYLRPGGPNQ